ncbi:unnamed protein product [Cylindrotheca closterium]|uniref:Uncharacterized protein n=1 Tax=Cylindrotheca closterium TaxID=2856 RepID=A0AAD2CDI6_9STRA|nr:unnamed protein product [Cylindrotheca closterium]
MSLSISLDISSLLKTTALRKRKDILNSLHDFAITPRGKLEFDMLRESNKEFRLCTIALMPKAVVNQLSMADVSFSIPAHDLDESHRKQLNHLILNRTTFKDFIKRNSSEAFRKWLFVNASGDGGRDELLRQNDDSGGAHFVTLVKTDEQPDQSTPDTSETESDEDFFSFGSYGDADESDNQGIVALVTPTEEGNGTFDFETVAVSKPSTSYQPTREDLLRRDRKARPSASNKGGT